MRQKGSYTVEAALLMGILLSVLVSEIYLGFWYHDRNFLQNAAYEAVCTASLRAMMKAIRLVRRPEALQKEECLAHRRYPQTVRIQRIRQQSFIVERFRYLG